MCKQLQALDIEVVYGSTMVKRRFYAECAVVSDDSPRKTLSILDFSVFAYLGPLRWLK